MRADEMLEKDNLAGYAVWRRILLALEELQRMERVAGDRLHLGFPSDLTPRGIGRTWRERLGYCVTDMLDGTSRICRCLRHGYWMSMPDR